MSDGDHPVLAPVLQGLYRVTEHQDLGTSEMDGGQRDRSKKYDETEDEYKNNLYYYKNYIHILKAKIRTGTETMARIYGKELCT